MDEVPCPLTIFPLDTVQLKVRFGHEPETLALNMSVLPASDGQLTEMVGQRDSLDGVWEYVSCAVADVAAITRNERRRKSIFITHALAEANSITE